MPRHSRFGIQRVQQKSNRHNIYLTVFQQYGKINEMTFQIRSDNMFDENDTKILNIEMPHSRAAKLCNDILNYIGAKRKEAEWKPTQSDLIDALEKQNINMFITDYARQISVFKNSKQKEINQLIQSYEWLKNNEKWLYSLREVK